MTRRAVERPGFLGRERDARFAAYDARYGSGRWTLNWVVRFPDGHEESFEFEEACRTWYEEAYFQHLKDRAEDLDFVCSFGECIDHAPSNVGSGCEYGIQEGSATHIQDIAVRNVLRRLGRRFDGPPDRLLVIRGRRSEGGRFGPGLVPFHRPELITRPSLRPSWAREGSVEDFWQSNKWLHVQEGG